MPHILNLCMSCVRFSELKMFPGYLMVPQFQWNVFVRFLSIINIIINENKL
jgi:hypothetical protein